MGSSVITHHPLKVVFATAIGSFLAGISAYQFVIDTAKLDVVQENTYVLKEDFEGVLLRKEAIAELSRLIEVGELLDPGEPRSISWLVESLTFIHHLGLDRDSDWEGRRVSSEEAMLRWAQLQTDRGEQVGITLGVLRGLRSAFSSREGKKIGEGK